MIVAAARRQEPYLCPPSRGPSGLQCACLSHPPSIHHLLLLLLLSAPIDTSGPPLALDAIDGHNHCDRLHSYLEIAQRTRGSGNPSSPSWLKTSTCPSRRLCARAMAVAHFAQIRRPDTGCIVFASHWYTLTPPPLCFSCVADLSRLGTSFVITKKVRRPAIPLTSSTQRSQSRPTKPWTNCLFHRV